MPMMKQSAVPMKILVVLASVLTFLELVHAGPSPPQVTVSFHPFVFGRWRLGGSIHRLAHAPISFFISISRLESMEAPMAPSN